MKKIFLAIIILFIGAGVFAQKINDVKDFVQKKDWPKAKDAVDKYLANEKNASKSEGWYYKGFIYNAMSKEDQYKGLFTSDPKMEAFDAFKKYIDLDDKDFLMVAEQYVSLFDLYNGFFDNGATAFNNKDFMRAYEQFKNAVEVQQYIHSKDLEYNGFKFSALDTSLVTNVALSARQAKRDDLAIPYYMMIADAKVGGENYLEPYQYMLEYFLKKGDNANAEKIRKIGIELYPDNDYWYTAELTLVDDNDKPALYKKYEELLANYPDNYSLNFNYAIELYNELYTRGDPPPNAAEIASKFEKYAKHAHELKPEAGVPDMLLTRHYYNEASDLSDAVRKVTGKTPADTQKKTDLTGKMNDALKNAVSYGEVSYKFYEGLDKLKAVDKANYKIVTDILSRCYSQLNNKEKSDFYEKKLDEIDKM